MSNFANKIIYELYELWKKKNQNGKKFFEPPSYGVIYKITVGCLRPWVRDFSQELVFFDFFARWLENRNISKLMEAFFQENPFLPDLGKKGP